MKVEQLHNRISEDEEIGFETGLAPPHAKKIRKIIAQVLLTNQFCKLVRY